MHYGVEYYAGNGLRAIECMQCGYAHLSPLPSQEELDALYRDEYYELHNAGWFEKERREQWYWRKVYRQRLTTARRWIDFECPAISDVGAGCGWFALALYYDAFVWGHEPNKAAVRYSETFEELLFIFDIDVLGAMKHPVWHMVHFSLALEHLLDPLDALKKAHKDLLPGGVLCIVVPNEWNPLQRQLAERHGYSPLHPHHVNYFDRGSIVRLVEKAGFEVVRVTSTFPMEWLALHGLNYVKFPILGTIAHWLRMAIEWVALTVAPERWERVRDGWAVKGWGREAEIWARKSG